MAYNETIRGLSTDPEGLEQAYRTALTRGEEDDFAAALRAEHAVAGDNVLLAAWHYRFLYAAKAAARRAIAWSWALPLALANGLALWWLSDDDRFILRPTNPVTGSESYGLPTVVLVAAPITAVVILAFLAGAGDRRWRRAGAIAAALAALSAYVVVLYTEAGPRLYQDQYLGLAAMSLALLSWASVGLHVLVGKWDAPNRFAFLQKSLEFAVVGGLFGILLGLLTGITVGLFDALGEQLSNPVARLFVAGGAGAVAVVAAALVVEPGVPPRGQDFDDGPSRLVAQLLRMLLPLAIIVLVAFLTFIPANFREPFENRDVLIIFNATLFAVVALLIGVVPTGRDELGPRGEAWLRRGVVAVALLALVVGVYALAAIVYRTAEDRLTPNRLVFIGWNVINIGLFAWLLVRQWRATAAERLTALRRSLADGMVPYAAWAALTVLALPWTFDIDLAGLAALPPSIARLAGDEPYPILLKCEDSPHVFLLEGGEKRWIKDIPTFVAEGFEWRDVYFRSCDEVDAVPLGQPIPPDAGPPPATTPDPAPPPLAYPRSG